MSGDCPVLVVPEKLSAIKWLIGKWESIEAKGDFPTVSPFQYNEIIEFALSGHQPLLTYNGLSQHPVSGNPMHSESGFLRVRGENELSFMVAHNFGLTTIEEGKVDKTTHQIILKADTTHINRMSLDPLKNSEGVQVIELERTFTLDPSNGQLIQETKMATTKTPILTPHLRVIYKSQTQPIV